MKFRNRYFKISKFNPSLKLFVISLSLLIALQSVSSSQSSQQGAKVSHQQPAIAKDRTEESDPTGPSQSVGKYSTKTYSPSSNYYVYPNSPYNGYYNTPVSDPYYDGYYERPSRQISARSSTYPMLAAASSQVGFPEPEYGGLAAATGHNSHGHSSSGHGGHGGHAGGHGGGWGGWSGGHGHYESVSKVDTSSLGLLGLLGLLSLLSNVLNLITTTAAAATPAPAPAPGRRKRRAVMIDDDEIQYEDVGSGKNRIVRVCERILPSLNIIGHAQNLQVPVNCTHQEVCKTNRILIDEFGVQGRAVGSVMSKAILKMLSDVDKTEKQDKYLLKASLDGRNGLDCEIVYPTCETLGKSLKALPQLLSPEHVYKIVHGQNPHISIPKIFASP